MRALRVAVILALVVHGAEAQGAYEIEVYSTEIVPVNSLVLELHSNYTFRGSEVSVGGTRKPPIEDAWFHAGGASLLDAPSAQSTCASGPFVQRAGAPGALRDDRAFASSSCTTTQIENSYVTHESIEAVTGLSSWSEIGASLFTNEQASPVVRPVGGSLRVKARAPATWNWPVNVAVSTELEYDDPSISADAWSLELRPVVDRAIGRWYVSVNPTIERTLRGAGVVNGLQFSPSAKASFDLTGLITAGVEYYGAYGKIGAFAPPDSRLQQIFGAVDLHFSALWELNAGVGAGTTPASNHLVAKLIFGRRFSWN